MSDGHRAAVIMCHAVGPAKAGHYRSDSIMLGRMRICSADRGWKGRPRGHAVDLAEVPELDLALGDRVTPEQQRRLYA